MKMDVTGLVLSIGEQTTRRAVRALEKQTVPCKDIVVVEHVTPFHKAINKGIAQIKTPFFLQCDADMIPDPDCIEVMLSFVKKDTGVVIGYLADEMLGYIQAIKMFRTECFRKVKFSDNVSPDTRCILQMKKKGYRYVFARRRKKRFNHSLGVFGKHKPEYTPLYTFSKFRLEGARIRYRGSFEEYEAALARLTKSRHSMAKIALIAFCHGFFDDRRKDGLRPYRVSKDFMKLSHFLRSENQKKHDFAITKN